MKESPSTAAAAASPGRLRGLDGLRAVAVVAVVLYHFNPAVLPGGFLGVDLFFVISGYLITRLLLAEIQQTGRLSILNFYRRRVRRLVPAVLVLVAAVAIADAVGWRDQLATLRGNALAGLGFFANWWLILAKQSYFVASGRPSMLQHLWSLGIEEQFYLVWPVLMALVLAPALLLARQRNFWRRRTGAVTVLRPRSLSRLAFVAGGLAIISTVLMTVIAVHTDVPYGADSARVYYGTDTHAMGLFLGAAAGALATRGGLPGARRRRMLRGAFLSDLAGAVALGLLVRAALLVDEFQPDLYRGQFLAVAFVAAVAVSAVPRRGSLLGWLLERAPLRWLGTRSYSLYLWHWPVAVVTRPQVDLSWPTVPLFLFRVAVSLALAELSYRFVERPVRDGSLGRVLARARAHLWGRETRRPVLRRLLPVGVLAVVLVVGGVSSSVAYSSEPGLRISPAASLGFVSPTPGPLETPFAIEPILADQPPLLAATPTATPTAMPASMPTAVPPPPSSIPTPTPAPQSSTHAVGAVSAFGDSVMLGAAPALSAALDGRVDVHAVEGRQARDVFADIAATRAAGQLAPDVVIQTGDNGIVSPTDLATALQALTDRARVVLLNDRVPKDWQDPNNALFGRVAGSYPNVVCVDWFAASNGHSDWFYNDGLHLRPAGAGQYAALIQGALTS